MTIPTQATREVVAAYVAALQAGDVEALRASFATDGTWTLHGDVPVAGTWKGADEIFDGFLAQLVARLDVSAGVTQTLHRIVADGDYAVAEWTSRRPRSPVSRTSTTWRSSSTSWTGRSPQPGSTPTRPT